MIANLVKKIAIFIVIIIISSVMYLFVIWSGAYDRLFLKMHNIHYLINDGKIYPSYKPFSDPIIDKVCLLLDGGKLRKYGLAENVDFYGYMAIIEYRKNSVEYGFAKTSQIDHDFHRNHGLAFCTENPEKIEVIRGRKYWRLTDSNKIRNLGREGSEWSTREEK